MRPVHRPRSPLPRGGLLGDQLPPAALHAADAGVGPRGEREDPASVRRGHPAGISLLLLRRRHAARAILMRASQDREPERSRRAWRMLGLLCTAELLGMSVWFAARDRKSTRLNSSHLGISYA